MYSSDTTPDVLSLLRRALMGSDFRKKTVSFLLGTDKDIALEARVAFTPRHMRQLRNDLAALGLEPRLFAISGAGERALHDDRPGYGDDEYRDVGVEVVELANANTLPALDVVHALKEPTAYESELPGLFLRIGALHLASKPPGVCQMLRARNFAAIFDGGTVGNCSYLKFGGDRTPIVACMSRFAGAVAGRKLVEGLEAKGHRPGTIVVVGGGIAGQSAIDQVVDKALRLIVIEPNEASWDRLSDKLRGLGFNDSNFEIQPVLDDDAMEGAIGIIFAHRSGAKAAEKVCSFAQIQLMKPGAAIADIAIDQGGSILHDDYREEDDATASRAKYQKLLADYAYYAETNMPREEPRQASEMHGDASLPYVTTLLALSALHGGPSAAAAAIREQEVRLFASQQEVGDLDLLAALMQDLRNGLQLAVVDGKVEIVDNDIERDQALVSWISSCTG